MRFVEPWRIVRFAAVGLGATALYAVAALMLEHAGGMQPVAASLAAYALAAVFSYGGHKFVTFASEGAHRQEAPRFAVLTAAGFAVALAAPLALTDLLGLPSWLAVGLTCVLIPIVNLLVLDRWVFGPGRAA